MSYAIYNPATNKVRNWVTEAKGSIPDGWEFRPKASVPSDAQVEIFTEIIPVPQEVPMWALKEVCVSRNHTAAIDTALASLPEPPRIKAILRWEYKNTISRGSSMITSMQALLGWSNAYVDELFIAAHTLAKS